MHYGSFAAGTQVYSVDRRAAGHSLLIRPVWPPADHPPAELVYPLDSASGASPSALLRGPGRLGPPPGWAARPANRHLAEGALAAYRLATAGPAPVAGPVDAGSFAYRGLTCRVTVASPARLTVLTPDGEVAAEVDGAGGQVPAIVSRLARFTQADEPALLFAALARYREAFSPAA
ncbi:hypothetical protein [Longispora albida]|uniref:hypothetical protein n=1 Tax=Longispora albida TaxID=203523 RepID=UPI000382D6EE|nr:hypothetical protein [Longispora albida]